MTSVQNLLQRLSGNRFFKAFFIGLLLVGTMACGALKPSVIAKPSDKPTAEPHEKPKEHPVHPPKEETKTSKAELRKKAIEDSLNILYPPTLKPTYSMMLLLPFYLDAAEKNQSYITIAKDFYKGVLIAKTKLENCGARLKINVIDSEFPLLTKSSLADSLEENNTDIIIGPLFENSRASFVDTLAKVKKINQVAPLQSSDKCVGSNYYIESIPSSAITGVKTAAMIEKEYPNRRTILINQKNTNADPIAKAFVAEFQNKDSLKIVNYSDKQAAKYELNYVLSDTNVVFIPSRDESFVLAVLSQLRLSGKQVVVVGLTSWMFFNTQEGDLWEKFNIHISSPFFMDYSRAELQDFVKQYRSKFKEEPSIWAYFGYDEVFFYGSMLNTYGKYFQKNLLENVGIPMLHSKYNLKPDVNCAGWRNNYINMLKFQDYTLQPAQDNE